MALSLTIRFLKFCFEVTTYLTGGGYTWVKLGWIPGLTPAAGCKS